MGGSNKFHKVLAAAFLGILLPSCAGSRTNHMSRPASNSNNASVVAIVDAQLAAYNKRDVEAFLSFYSDDAKLFENTNQLVESGKEQLRVRYQKSFLDKNVRAVILKRIVFDRFVIDHERLIGHPDGLIEAIAVYEVKGGKIVSVAFYSQ